MKRKLFALFALLALFCILLTGCREEQDEQLAAKPVIYLYPEGEESAEAKPVDYLYPEGEESAEAKPVDYLYPEAEMEVTVRLDYDGELACTYPAYHNGWTVTVRPDGTLTDERGQTYSYLYWEGVSNTEYDFSQGFCVPGSDTAAFLEDALAQLGLNRREANEFIVYWLPRMEQNPYNLISFQAGAYTDHAVLTVTPEPDSILRVFMAWKPLEAPVELLAQDLPAFSRTGFAVVEWGGAEVR